MALRATVIVEEALKPCELVGSTVAGRDLCRCCEAEYSRPLPVDPECDRRK